MVRPSALFLFKVGFEDHVKKACNGQARLILLEDFVLSA